MKTYYTETRPNGKPVEAGTLCFVTDMEDGTNPIYTYGKSEPEIMEKLGLTALHNRNALQRTATQPPAGQPQAAAPAAPRKRLSADQVAQNVLDIQANPDKAGDAIVALVEDATGVNLREQAAREFFAMAKNWEEENPNLFYPHDGNRRLIMERAKVLAGGDLTRATREILSQSVQELQQQNLLFEPEAEQPPPQQQQPPQSSTTFPGVSPVQRTERPRGTRFAMSTRSTNFATPQVTPPKTLKYTEAQFRAMSSERSRQLIQAGDPDYLAANEVYGQAAATA